MKITLASYYFGQFVTLFIVGLIAEYSTVTWPLFVGAAIALILSTIMWIREDSNE